jgi:hypothetical protein
MSGLPGFLRTKEGEDLRELVSLLMEKVIRSEGDPAIKETAEKFRLWIAGGPSEGKVIDFPSRSASALVSPEGAESLEGGG